MKVLFYPACADHRPIDHNYIRKGCVFTCFEDALNYEKGFFHDDDDWGVIGRVDNIWFRVWKRSEKGELLVSDDTGLRSGWIDALPLEEYLCFKKINTIPI